MVVPTIWTAFSRTSSVATTTCLKRTPDAAESGATQASAPDCAQRSTSVVIVSPDATSALTGTVARTAVSCVLLTVRIRASESCVSLASAAAEDTVRNSVLSSSSDEAT